MLVLPEIGILDIVDTPRNILSPGRVDAGWEGVKVGAREEKGRGTAAGMKIKSEF